MDEGDSPIGKKWRLPSGTLVEDAMYKVGLSCQYEHPVHSFIFCIDDPCWQKVFGKEDLQAIILESDPSSQTPESCSGAHKRLEADYAKFRNEAEERKQQAAEDTIVSCEAVTEQVSKPKEKRVSAFRYGLWDSQREEPK